MDLCSNYHVFNSRDIEQTKESSTTNSFRLHTSNFTYMHVRQSSVHSEDIFQANDVNQRYSGKNCKLFCGGEFCRVCFMPLLSNSLFTEFEKAVLENCHVLNNLMI